MSENVYIPETSQPQPGSNCLRLAAARESSVSEVRPSAKPRLKIGHGRGSLKGPLSTRGLRATRPHKGWTSWVLGFGNPWYFTLSQARSSLVGLRNVTIFHFCD